MCREITGLERFIVAKGCSRLENEQEQLDTRCLARVIKLQSFELGVPSCRRLSFQPVVFIPCPSVAVVRFVSTPCSPSAFRSVVLDLEYRFYDAIRRRSMIG